MLFKELTEKLMMPTIAEHEWQLPFQTHFICGWLDQGKKELPHPSEDHVPSYYSDFTGVLTEVGRVNSVT